MAFYQCENLKKLYLPKDVLFVREYAFFGCDSLTELHLNDGVAMYNEAFADCTSLKKVYSKGFYSLSYESRLFRSRLKSGIWLREKTKELAIIRFGQMIFARAKE